MNGLNMIDEYKHLERNFLRAQDAFQRVALKYAPIMPLEEVPEYIAMEEAIAKFKEFKNKNGIEY